MAVSDQFCLRWNDHQNTIMTTFDTLLDSQKLTDVTLFAGGKSLKAHKVVLSACSPYFDKMLEVHDEKNPIIVFNDLSYDQLRAMLEYMYRGEVNVSQEQLDSFLKVAESLKIKGLTDQGGGGDIKGGGTKKKPLSTPLAKDRSSPAGKRRRPNRRGSESGTESIEEETKSESAGLLQPKIELTEDNGGGGVEDLTMEEEEDDDGYYHHQAAGSSRLSDGSAQPPHPPPDIKDFASWDMTNDSFMGAQELSGNNALNSSQVRFLGHGTPNFNVERSRADNAVSTEGDIGTSGNNPPLSVDVPSTSGEEFDDCRPPPGLTGKALGLWHRDKKRKEKALRKKEKKEKKQKVQCIPLDLGHEKIHKIQKIIGNVNLERIKKLRPEPSSGTRFNIHEKYIDMQESEFKRRFIKSITGSLQDRIKQGGMRSSSLLKLPQLDQRYKRELHDKFDFNEKFKHYLPIREKLPAFHKRKEIIDSLENSNKLLISGETGCGKTTQVAQFLLEHEILSNRGSTCSIICTQPRRISAISVAERVAAERGERIGESVGYQIRLEKESPRESCCILFCTTGVLLKFMQNDPLLTFASHIVLDEVHERDTLSDFVITLLRDILPVRPDLKVVLMSATLNAEKFSKYFDSCPMIHIPGFTFPVKQYYLEDALEMTGFKFHLSKRFQKHISQEREGTVMPYLRMLEHEKKYPQHVIASLMDPGSEEISLELIVDLLKYLCTDHRYSRGAVLIFLPGWDKISRLNRMITENGFFPQSRYIIIPLHSMMPTVSQKSIFDPPPPGKRKIIIATNIAETSITIDDVVYVIDCGKIKIKNFDIENNLTTMKEEWVSLANAQQRRGRAGRVQAGVCFHLFTRAREMVLAQYQLPEMLRTRLEEVILQAKILQLGKIAPFLSSVLDPPNPKAVELSLKLLHGMRALDDDENLTPLGYHLGNLPVDPQAGKMLIFASLFSCFDPISSVAACLGFKDPFFIPLGKEKEVDARKKELSGGMKSDHLLLAEVISMWERAEERGKGWEFCRSNFLSHNTLSLLRDMKNQFARHLYEMKFLASDKSRCTSGNFNSNYPGLLKAIICAGLYPNIAIIKKQKVSRKTGMGCVMLYTPEDGKVALHPKSVNNKQCDFASKFLVYFEKIKSTGIFLHDSTMIPPLALIFFCQKLTVEDDSSGPGKIITVNECIKFTCSTYAADLIQDLRTALDWILENKIAHPGISDLCDPYSDSIESRLLRAIVELITIEDEEVNYDYSGSDYSDDYY